MPFGIGLANPKTAINVGHALRAADAYSASFMAITGSRAKVVAPTDTSKFINRIPLVRGDNLHDLIPFGWVPIAVELVEGAKDLREFVHPTNAFYIFGAEDATLGHKVLDWCEHTIYVPTRICMNLSACVNVVCYDRFFKLGDAR